MPGENKKRLPNRQSCNCVFCFHGFGYCSILVSENVQYLVEDCFLFLFSLSNIDSPPVLQTRKPISSLFLPVSIESGRFSVTPNGQTQKSHPNYREGNKFRKQIHEAGTFQNNIPHDSDKVINRV